MKSIKVSEEHHAELVAYAAYLTFDAGEKRGLDDAVGHLLEKSFFGVYQHSSKHCARCNKEMDFDTWMQGGQGYCKECFDIVCKEASG